MPPNIRGPNSHLTDVATQELARKLLSSTFAKQRIAGPALQELRRDLAVVKDGFVANGYQRAGMLVNEIDKLFTVIHECVSCGSNEPGLSTIERYLLIDAASALLIQYYDLEADERYYLVPQPLIDGIHSCVTLRHRELEYLCEVAVAFPPTWEPHETPNAKRQLRAARYKKPKQQLSITISGIYAKEH